MAEATNNLKLTITSNPNQVKQEGANAAKNFASGFRNIQRDLAGISGAFEKFSQPLGRITGQASEFEKSMEAANARVLAFGASAAIIGGVGKAFKDLVSSTIEVEASLKNLQVITNATVKDMADYSKQLFDVAKNSATSFKDATKAALEFSRQGLAMNDVISRTNDAMIMTRLTGISLGEAISGITATINAFNNEDLSSSQILNSLSAIDLKTAASTDSIVKGLARSASAATAAGVSFKELSSAIAAMQAHTGLQGGQLGNSMKAIMTRILDEKNALTKLEEQGVQIRSDNGELLKTMDILKNLAKALKENPAFKDNSFKTTFLKDIFGLYQVDKSIALLNDMGKSLDDLDRNQLQKISNRFDELGLKVKVFKENGETRSGIDVLKQISQEKEGRDKNSKEYKALDEGEKLVSKGTSDYEKNMRNAENATTEAYMKNEVLNDTLDAQIEKFKTLGQQALSTFGNTAFLDNAKESLKAINTVLELINESMSDGALKYALQGISEVITGPGLAIGIAVLVKGFSTAFTQIKNSAEAFLGLNQQMKLQQEIERATLQYVQQHADLQEVMMKNEGDIQNVALEVVAAFQAQELSVKNLATNLAKVAALVRSTMPNLQSVGQLSIEYQSDQARKLIKRNGSISNLATGDDAITKEITSIRNGVGGAQGKDKPVILDNFPLNGVKQTIVANTGEYIVDMGNGRKSILNRNQYRKIQEGKNFAKGAKKEDLDILDPSSSSFLKNLGIKANPSLYIKPDITLKIAKGVDEQYSSSSASGFKYGLKSGDIQYGYENDLITPISELKNLDMLPKKELKEALFQQVRYFNSAVGTAISNIKTGKGDYSGLSEKLKNKYVKNLTSFQKKLNENFVTAVLNSNDEFSKQFSNTQSHVSTTGIKPQPLQDNENIKPEGPQTQNVIANLQKQIQESEEKQERKKRTSSPKTPNRRQTWRSLALPDNKRGAESETPAPEPNVVAPPVVKQEPTKSTKLTLTPIVAPQPVPSPAATPTPGVKDAAPVLVPSPKTKTEPIPVPEPKPQTTFEGLLFKKTQAKEAVLQANLKEVLPNISRVIGEGDKLSAFPEIAGKSAAFSERMSIAQEELKQVENELAKIATGAAPASPEVLDKVSARLDKIFADIQAINSLAVTLEEDVNLVEKGSRVKKIEPLSEAEVAKAITDPVNSKKLAGKAYAINHSSFKKNLAYSDLVTHAKKEDFEDPKFVKTLPIGVKRTLGVEKYPDKTPKEHRIIYTPSQLEQQVLTQMEYYSRPVSLAELKDLDNPIVQSVKRNKTNNSARNYEWLFDEKEVDRFSGKDGVNNARAVYDALFYGGKDEKERAINRKKWAEEQEAVDKNYSRNMRNLPSIADKNMRKRLGEQYENERHQFYAKLNGKRYSTANTVATMFEGGASWVDDKDFNADKWRASKNFENDKILGHNVAKIKKIERETQRRSPDRGHQDFNKTLFANNWLYGNPLQQNEDGSYSNIGARVPNAKTVNMRSKESINALINQYRNAQVEAYNKSKEFKEKYVLTNTTDVRSDMTTERFKKVNSLIEDQIALLTKARNALVTYGEAGKAIELTPPPGVSGVIPEPGVVSTKKGPAGPSEEHKQAINTSLGEKGMAGVEVVKDNTTALIGLSMILGFVSGTMDDLVKSGNSAAIVGQKLVKALGTFISSSFVIKMMGGEGMNLSSLFRGRMSSIADSLGKSKGVVGEMASKIMGGLGAAVSKVSAAFMKFLPIIGWAITIWQVLPDSWTKGITEFIGQSIGLIKTPAEKAAESLDKFIDSLVQGTGQISTSQIASAGLKYAEEYKSESDRKKYGIDNDEEKPSTESIWLKYVEDRAKKKHGSFANKPVGTIKDENLYKSVFEGPSYDVVKDIVESTGIQNTKEQKYGDSWFLNNYKFDKKLPESISYYEKNTNPFGHVSYGSQSSTTNEFFKKYSMQGRVTLEDLQSISGMYGSMQRAAIASAFKNMPEELREKLEDSSVSDKEKGRLVSDYAQKSGKKVNEQTKALHDYVMTLPGVKDSKGGVIGGEYQKQLKKILEFARNNDSLDLGLLLQQLGLENTPENIEALKKTIDNFSGKVEMALLKLSKTIADLSVKETLPTAPGLQKIRSEIFGQKADTVRFGSQDQAIAKSIKEQKLSAEIRGSLIKGISKAFGESGPTPEAKDSWKSLLLSDNLSLNDLRKLTVEMQDALNKASLSADEKSADAISGQKEAVVDALSKIDNYQASFIKSSLESSTRLLAQIEKSFDTRKLEDAVSGVSMKLNELSQDLQELSNASKIRKEQRNVLSAAKPELSQYFQAQNTFDDIETTKRENALNLSKARQELIEAMYKQVESLPMGDVKNDFINKIGNLDSSGIAGEELAKLAEEIFTNVLNTKQKNDTDEQIASLEASLENLKGIEGMQVASNELLSTSEALDNSARNLSEAGDKLKEAANGGNNGTSLVDKIVGALGANSSISKALTDNSFFGKFKDMWNKFAPQKLQIGSKQQPTQPVGDTATGVAQQRSTSQITAREQIEKIQELINKLRTSQAGQATLALNATQDTSKYRSVISSTNVADTTADLSKASATLSLFEQLVRTKLQNSVNMITMRFDVLSKNLEKQNERIDLQTTKLDAELDNLPDDLKQQMMAYANYNASIEKAKNSAKADGMKADLDLLKEFSSLKNAGHLNDVIETFNNGDKAGSIDKYAQYKAKEDAEAEYKLGELLKTELQAASSTDAIEKLSAIVAQNGNEQQQILDKIASLLKEANDKKEKATQEASAQKPQQEATKENSASNTVKDYNVNVYAATDSPIAKPADGVTQNLSTQPVQEAINAFSEFPSYMDYVIKSLEAIVEPATGVKKGFSDIVTMLDEFSSSFRENPFLNSLKDSVSDDNYLPGAVSYITPPVTETVGVYDSKNGLQAIPTNTSFLPGDFSNNGSYLATITLAKSDPYTVPGAQKRSDGTYLGAQMPPVNNGEPYPNNNTSPELAESTGEKAVDAVQASDDTEFLKSLNSNAEVTKQYVSSIADSSSSSITLQKAMIEGQKALKSTFDQAGKYALQAYTAGTATERFESQRKANIYNEPVKDVAAYSGNKRDAEGNPIQGTYWSYQEATEDLSQRMANASASGDTEQLKELQIQALQLKKSLNQRLEFKTLNEGWQNSLAQMKDEAGRLEEQMGSSILDLKNGFVDAFSTAISGSKSFGNAFADEMLNVAQNVIKQGINSLISNMFNRLFSGMFTQNTAQGIDVAASGLLGDASFLSTGTASNQSRFGFATGGKVTGGSGTKDDVPAMLTGGEYVINKKAVKSLGTKFLDALNNGGIGMYSSGGYVSGEFGDGWVKDKETGVVHLDNGALTETTKTNDGTNGFFSPTKYGYGQIAGTNNLKAFAMQSFTSGANDVTTSDSSGSLVSLETESMQLSQQARAADNAENRELEQDKQTALNLAYEEDQRRYEYEQQKKAQKKAWKNALIGLGATVGLGYITGAIGGGKKWGFSSVLGGSSTALGRGAANLANWWNTNSNDVRGIFQNASASGINVSSFNLLTSKKSDSDKSKDSESTDEDKDKKQKAIGGQITSGVAGRDNQTINASQGEYVISREAVNSVGTPFLDALNSNKVSFSDASATQNTGNGMDISQLITKLEEVVAAIRETAGAGGESNITINVSSTYEGQSSENEEGDGTDDDKALAQKIKDVVKQTISEEKRVGGLLSNLKA